MIATKTSGHSTATRRKSNAPDRTRSRRTFGIILGQFSHKSAVKISRRWFTRFCSLQALDGFLLPIEFLEASGDHIPHTRVVRSDSSGLAVELEGLGVEVEELEDLSEAVPRAVVLAVDVCACEGGSGSSQGLCLV